MMATLYSAYVISLTVLLMLVLVYTEEIQVIPFNKNLQTAMQCGCRQPQQRFIYIGNKITALS